MRKTGKAVETQPICPSEQKGPCFKVGEKVSLDRWDATEPPWNQIGNAKIMKITTGQRCESGIMATVRNAKGSEQELDIAWLQKL